jgi:ferredoxin-NADP reductase
MRLILRDKHEETSDVWTFVFEPQEQISWTAGQSIRLEIPGPYGPIEHRFSISTAPSTHHIGITTRLSGSDYKDSLNALRIGDRAQGFDIRSDISWRDSHVDHIFIAAGIGIVPFNAIIAERLAQKLPLSATLLYSSRDTPVVFKAQLEQVAAAHPEFVAHFARTRITAAQVLALPHAHERLVYIAGPNKMVSDMSADLIAAGIAPAQIIQDRFTGRLSEDG